jgi:hypothetical protein
MMMAVCYEQTEEAIARADEFFWHPRVKKIPHDGGISGC